MMLLGSACSSASTSAAPPGSDMSRVPVGERPRAIESADLDADGRADLVVGNADSDSVSILIASPDGGFRRADVPAGNEPSDVELVDIDRDGDPDIVVANHETSGVTILLNDGSGQFTAMPGSPFDLGARPHLHGLATGDFDGDGYVDIAADSSDSDSLAVMRGRSGGFKTPEAVPAGRFPYYRIDEFSSGDGKVFSILVPSPRAGTVRTLELKGAPRLGPVLEAPGAMMVLAGKFGGRGARDVVAIGDNQLRLWLDGKTGHRLTVERRFDNPVEIAVGDVDGDGIDEIAVSLWDSDSISILSADGRTRGSITACMRPAALLLSDLDGDGRAELVAGCWNEPEVRIFRNLP